MIILSYQLNYPSAVSSLALNLKPPEMEHFMLLDKIRDTVDRGEVIGEFKPHKSTRGIILMTQTTQHIAVFLALNPFSIPYYPI